MIRYFASVVAAAPAESGMALTPEDIDEPCRTSHTIYVDTSTAHYVHPSAFG